jgi:hypothetical protein
MNDLFVQILAQALNIEAGHIIDGLLLVVCFFVVMFMKDMKASLKEIHSMFLRHDRKITRLEERANVKDEE